MAATNNFQRLFGRFGIWDGKGTAVLHDLTMLKMPCVPSHNGNAHHPRFAAVRRPLASALAVLILGALGSVGLEQSASAATVSCSTPNLISAIATANGTPGGGTLVLAPGCVYSLESANNTTEGGTGLPVITGNVMIQGAGATIARSTATGVPAFRIFDVADGGILTLNSLTLSNGLANNGQQGGGAIFNHGTLTVTAGTFTNNSSPAATGTSGGAIDSTGTLSVNTSTFSGNSAQEGGGIMNQSTATVTNSTFAGNNATDFGGGALVNTAGTATVAGDTFVGNTGPGGGALDNDATLNITNSTFTNNTAGTNGGGAVVNFGTTTVNQSTFSGNTAPFGANLYNFTGFTLSMSMDIVAGGLTGTNCGGGAAITDLGYNIDDGTSCGFSAANHSLSSTDPGLDALAWNGGSTETMALPAGSPAVDAIPPATPGCPGSTDQRGIARPQGTGCDIGAYELAVASGDTQPPSVPTGLATTSVTSGSVSLSWNASSDNVGVTGYTVYRNGTLYGTTGSGATTYTDATVAPSTSYSYTVDAFDAAGNHSAQSSSLAVTTPAGLPLNPYSPVTPVRICDTRAGNPSMLNTFPSNQCNGLTLAAGGTRTINVANADNGGIGSFGVPADATAVVLNVTVVNPIAQGYVTAYPAGGAQPFASNINYVAGEVVPNLVEVGVGALGDVSLFSSAGTDVVVDVEGYTASTAAGGSGAGLYDPLSSPVRICDTRAGNPSGLSAPNNQCNGATVAANGTLPVKVANMNGIPAGATAAVLNVTDVNPQAQGFLTVFPQGSARPLASNVNYTAGQTTSNRVIVPLSVGGPNAGEISVFSAARADVVVDVAGYYTAAGGAGSLFSAEPAPVRICDTRSGNPSMLSGSNAQCNGLSLGTGGTRTVQVSGLAGVPSGATAVAINLTGVSPSAQTFLTVYPNALPNPLVSDLNEGPGDVRANMVVATLSSSGTFTIYNAAGSMDVVVDVLGWYS